ncbi:MAG: ParB/RepB/Spo0J family partition protein, partial [Clostridia bacterium]|nr:ParB/RepB/Spo0J family partition protein [Clostridia bacterium]
MREIVNPEIASYDEKGKLNQGVNEIAMDMIRANPNQPRKIFNEESLNELASSIKTHGVLQPIVLTKIGDGYRIVAGERRFRAAKIAELKTIPAVIKDLTEKEVREIALIENLQREDLNPMEESEA